MKKFETYDLFASRFAGPFTPMPEDCDLTGRVSEAVWNRLAHAGLALRDVRLYADDRLWTRFGHKDGLQAIVGWTPGGAVGAWTVPLEDCGAYAGEYEPYKPRTLDLWRLVRQMDELGQGLLEWGISKTIHALDLYGFDGSPDEFPVEVFGRSTRSVADALASLEADAVRFGELTRDDGEEVRTWKRNLLRLAAALGGNAPAQREMAWRVDPGNKTANGYRKDRRLAMYWYEKAAQKGDGLGANNLACFYVGEGECAKAKKWFRVAIRGGVEKAVESLRHCEECKARSRIMETGFCR